MSFEFPTLLGLTQGIQGSAHFWQQVALVCPTFCFPCHFPASCVPALGLGPQGKVFLNLGHLAHILIQVWVFIDLKAPFNSFLTTAC